MRDHAMGPVAPGFADAGERKLRVQLALRLNDLIAARQPFGLMTEIASTLMLDVFPGDRWEQPGDPTGDLDSIRNLRIIINACSVRGVARVRTHRSKYLDDDGLRRLQLDLLTNAEAGDLIAGTGGLRKLRQSDVRRGKGKRGGLRVIYFWWSAGRQFWLFTLYDKDEMDDLDSREKRLLKSMLKRELEIRQ